MPIWVFSLLVFFPLHFFWGGAGCLDVQARAWELHEPLWGYVNYLPGRQVFFFLRVLRALQQMSFETVEIQRDTYSM